MDILFVGNEFTNSSSRKGYIPRCIVNHITEGNKNSCISWFTSKENRNSSTHFLVARDGEIYQFVEIGDMAWGNGLNIKENPNLYTVSIEHEGIYSETHGELNALQLESSIALHKHIMKFIKEKYNYIFEVDRNNIVGHCDIDPIRKPNCPGENFPYNEIISKIKYDLDLPVDIKNHWAETIIINLYNKRILQGNGTDKFNPDKHITKAETAALVSNAINFLSNKYD